MKKFISVILTTGILFILLTWFLGKLDNIDKFTNTDINVSKLVHHLDSLDILFVGNSYCYSGINPLLFDSVGIKTFNMGISALGIFGYQLLIENYLARSSQKPKSIFILLSPTTFSVKSDNFASSPIHRYLKKEMSNEDLVFKYSLYGQYLKLAVNSLRKTVKNITGLCWLQDTKISEIEFYKNKGFYHSDLETNEKSEKLSLSSYISFKEEIFDNQKVKNLLNYVTYLENQNIKIVFYTLPTYKLDSFFSQNYLTNYNQMLDLISRKYEYVEIDLLLNSRYFRNMDHLNTKGAYYVSKNMIQKITNTSTISKIFSK